jgi:hypothetical protein
MSTSGAKPASKSNPLDSLGGLVKMPFGPKKTPPPTSPQVKPAESGAHSTPAAAQASVVAPPAQKVVAPGQAQVIPAAQPKLDALAVAEKTIQEADIPTHVRASLQSKCSTLRADANEVTDKIAQKAKEATELQTRMQKVQSEGNALKIELSKLHAAADALTSEALTVEEDIKRQEQKKLITVGVAAFVLVLAIAGAFAAYFMFGDSSSPGMRPAADPNALMTPAAPSQVAPTGTSAGSQYPKAAQRGRPLPTMQPGTSIPSNYVEEIYELEEAMEGSGCFVEDELDVVKKHAAAWLYYTHGANLDLAKADVLEDPPKCGF